MEEVREILGRLKDAKGIVGCGIVSRDGRPVDMRLPSGMNVETIAIMAATVFGGSLTLNTEAGKEIPRTINIRNEDFSTTISQCGRRSLAVVMMDSDSDFQMVNEYLDELGKVFGRD